MRVVVMVAASLIAGGCAEKNFVPGSPLAKAMGYNRSGEEIDAEACQAKHGLRPGTEMFGECLVALTVARRRDEAAHYRRSAALMQAGAAVMAQGGASPVSGAPPGAATCSTTLMGYGVASTGCTWPSGDRLTCIQTSLGSGAYSFRCR